MNITLPSTTSAAVSLLFSTILEALTDVTVQTTQIEKTWPFPFDTIDASTGQNLVITVNGKTSEVTFTFTSPNTPTVKGTLNLTDLEALLVSSPNYLDYDSPSSMGPAASITLTSPGFTRQKSGMCFLTAEFNGVQTDQAIVAAALYRDYGTGGQVNLNTWAFPPGGLAPYNWSGHIHDTDVLPDNSPHTYTLIVTGSGGSDLSVSAGELNIIVFELGAPG